jgi:hypothetical protein
MSLFLLIHGCGKLLPITSELRNHAPIGEWLRQAETLGHVKAKCRLGSMIKQFTFLEHVPESPVGAAAPHCVVPVTMEEDAPCGF